MSRYDDYKNDVWRRTKWLLEQGYFGSNLGSGGNVSVRIKNEQSLAITPSTIPYTELTPEMICVVDFDLKQIEGDLKPSVESGLHLAAYQSRPDAGAVVHTHQIKASVLSIINQPIPALFDEIAITIGDRVEVIPYALSGSAELARNTAAKLDNHCHCYLIQNHGALVLGENIDRACHYVELLEKAAEIYLAALMTGREITPLPQEMSNLLMEMVKDKQKKQARENNPE